MRPDHDKRSIVQRGIDRHKANPQPKIVKPGRFVLPVNEVSNGDVGELIIAPDLMSEFWFKAECVIRNKPYCWECGDFIHKDYYRAATAHIYPKSIFESVAANEWNYLVLGAGCGCHNLTHRLDTFSQMKVWPVAVQRYLKFGHLITEKHKYHDLFIEYANATI
jgi:hypothetical protein